MSLWQRILRRFDPWPELVVVVECGKDDHWRWTAYRRNPETWERTEVATGYTPGFDTANAATDAARRLFYRHTVAFEFKGRSDA